MTIGRLRAAELTALLIVSLIAMSLFAVAGTASAAADPGEPEFSWDGRTWSERLTGTLFPQGSVPVPGQSAGRVFWIRGVRPGGARVRIGTAVAGRDGSISSRALRLEAKIGRGSTWTPFIGGEVTQHDTGQLGRAGRFKIRVRATLDPGSEQSAPRTWPNFFITIQSEPTAGTGTRPQRGGGELVLRHQILEESARSGGPDRAASTSGEAAPTLAMPLVALAALIGAGLSFGIRVRPKTKFSHPDPLRACVESDTDVGHR